MKKLTAEQAPQPAAFQLLTRNYINHRNIVGWQANNGSFPDEERGYGWIPSLKTRLWSNHAKIRFSYPVHELVTPSLAEIGISAQPCPIIIHHYGKLNHKTAQAKSEKYFLLGLQKLDEMKEALIPLRELAVEAGVLGRYQDAINLWQRFLEIAPCNAEAHLNLGTALFASGNIKQALISAEKSSQLNPELKESHLNRSLYEIHLGQSESAAKRLYNLLQQVPEYQAASFLHAAAVCCRDDCEKGRQAFIKIQNDTLTAEVLAIAGDELARTMTQAGRLKDAENLKKATSG
ncbi:MAG: tetratricopeptide repeat protein [Deltaproteobacteria bacterium]|nr:tetratricopeptide repeat protein [Deltaproteobacteria bacterium]